MRVISLSTLALALAGSPLIASSEISLPRRGLDKKSEASAWTPLQLRSDISIPGDLEKRRGGGGGGGGRSSGGSTQVLAPAPAPAVVEDRDLDQQEAALAALAPLAQVEPPGGRTKSGSGVTPRFGGGRFYGGGASAPYTAGRRSPKGISPFVLPGVALGIFSGIWLYSAFAYPYNNPYYFRNTSRFARNRTLTGTPPIKFIRRQDEEGVVVELPVLCLCQEYSVCGCDDNDDTEFLTSLLPNGTDGTGLNETLAQVSDVNGTTTLVLNGTLPNGTTAPGGTEDPNATEDPSGAAAGTVRAFGGYWVMAAIVMASVWLL
ncbi:MAG: hypothetical protein M1825_000423 [Sarcosagium campestre]|nr:MAG: hypothetical protein M1825_000423 [Sarcosagium campestre]